MSSSDKLIIETPEQTELEFPLAGVGSRGLAVMIDSLLIAASWVVLGLLGVWINRAGFLSDLGKQWGAAVLGIVVFLIDFGYFAFFETVWNGQTPGKRWTHLRVIADSGRPIGAQQAILRNLLRIVDFLPFLYTVGIVSLFFSPENKRLGDYLAGTVVVLQRPIVDDRALWDAVQAPASMTAQPLPLTPGEFELVEAFLERRASLAPEIRAAVAREVAEKLGHRCGVPLEARSVPEKFLEQIAEQGREAGKVLIVPQAQGKTSA